MIENNNNQRVFLIQIVTSSYTYFDISEFELSKLNWSSFTMLTFIRLHRSYIVSNQCLHCLQVNQSLSKGLTLAHQTQLYFHMQTAWIRMRRLVTRRLTWTQAVWHSDNIFTNFEPHLSILNFKADDKLSRRQFIWRAKGLPEIQIIIFTVNIFSCISMNVDQILCYAKSVESFQRGDSNG